MRLRNPHGSHNNPVMHALKHSQITTYRPDEWASLFVNCAGANYRRYTRVRTIVYYPRVREELAFLLPVSFNSLADLLSSLTV